MPLRFRKTFTIFPGVRVNVSKGGTSITVGKKGFHLNFSKRGVRQTVGIPGTGISETNYIVKNDADDDKDEDKKEAKKEERAAEADDKPKQRSRRAARERGSSPWGFFAFVLVALFFFYFGASALGLLPPHFLTDIFQTLTHLVRQARL
jgi:hypothetical protein